MSPVSFFQNLFQSPSGNSLIALYLAAFFLCLLGNTFIIGFFLPAGTIVALCGFFVQRGYLNPGIAFLMVWGGMIVGSQIDFSFGRMLLTHIVGHSVSRRLMQRFHLDKPLERGMKFLGTHGNRAMYYAYATLGHFRSIITVSIGMSSIPYKKFWVHQLIASFLWSSIYLCIGYIIGSELNNISGSYQTIGIVAGAVFLGIYILWALWSAVTSEFNDPLIGRISFRRSSQVEEDLTKPRS